MEFTVLITLYINDKPEWFSEALYSITHLQSLQPTEVVLVCDGDISKENELIVSEYEGDERVNLKVYRLKENVGQGKALNYGLNKCSYEYVARMDSDDISSANRFEEQVTFLYENPDIDILSSTIREFNGEGAFALRSLPVYHEEIMKFAQRRSPVNHGCCIYKKSKVIKLGGYSELVQVQDWKLWVDMLLDGCRFHNLPAIHMDVRMNEGYSRKTGFSYLKEEAYLQTYFYRKGFIGLNNYLLNIVVRSLGRVFPRVLIELVYKRLYRGS